VSIVTRTRREGARVSSDVAGAEKSSLLEPPTYCHYANGPCDQTFFPTLRPTVFFAYPSAPENIAHVVEGAVEKLKASKGDTDFLPWKGLNVAGQTIFCEICKAMRMAQTVVADVTTLNFNLLFEIGFTIGLGVPVIPIRDTNYQADKRAFDELGLLDTIGYEDFTNVAELATKLLARLPGRPLPPTPLHEFRESPLYVLKGPVETEGALQVISAVKKSGIHFRTYDPVETPRLSLHEARRQVAGSAGVVANLLDPARAKALQHNAQCALIAGMALAQGKAVALLQEGHVAQPIDYRDVVQPYTNPNNIPGLLQPVLRRSIQALQEVGRTGQAPKDLLQRVDLGDVAAENEIGGLRDYFVVTGQATQAKQGHARLVIGRKGSGKTAVFYDVRNSIGRGHDRLVLDLKPEGHQFTKLRELVLDGMPSGLQEHTMVAFWNYILLAELARKALEQDARIAAQDPVRFEPYEKLKAVYLQHDPGGDVDFSQRLLMQVERLSRQLEGQDLKGVGSRLTEIIYRGDLRTLNDSVCEYLRTKSQVWLLVDNLDKGWPVKGTSSVDILIVRSLLDATRKLQHQLETNDVEFDCLVFLRSDIYEHLREETPDKGKDTAIRLDWEDPSVFREIVRRRFTASTGLDGEFRDLWRQICTPLVDGQDSFAYILDRTLMRPRDMLQFLREAIHTAINRGNSMIEEEDLQHAERGYSEDLLLTTSFEIGDTQPAYADVLYAFDGAPATMSREELLDRLVQLGSVGAENSVQVMELLIWFGFLGVRTPGAEAERYSYDTQSNMRRLLYPLTSGDALLVIHPAFRTALSVA
jgi:hypothetical protein